ncbi:Fe-S cluster assembly protein SufD [Prochlorothrix hollandica]|uniref:Fe-S cluster assembly protein SufD n=1 Tax=Prochlorothrix hollandica TaxID=1223 RepID=UPI00333E7B81
MVVQIAPDLSPNSTTIAPQTSAEKRSSYLAHLLALGQSVPSSLPPAIATAQAQAAARIPELAIPSSRHEDWRFTDLSALVQLQFQATPQVCSFTLGQLAALTIAEARHRLVFVDGHYSPSLSSVEDLPAGVTLGNIHQADPQRLAQVLGQQPGNEEVFTTLNTATFQDLAWIHLAEGVILDAPLHLIWMSTLDRQCPVVSQTRALILADRGSSLHLVEDFVTLGEGCTNGLASGTYFTNGVTEMVLGDNAFVHHSRLQRDGTGAFHIGKTAVSQGRDSRYVGVAIHLGAQMSRHNLEVVHQGEQAETELFGLALVNQAQVMDTHSSIWYQHPHCSSNQLYKAIVNDRGRSVFNGRVDVPQAAQLTNARQLNRNLLLSPQARVDTKPQLEIVADNVKCTHGATVSQLEDEEIFYFQSRGIDPLSAQHLLLDGFAAEILQKLPLESLRQSLGRCVACRMMDV